MNEHIITLTDASFENEVLQNEGAILVDFWAEWCGPCKALAPVLDGLADEYLGKVTIAKLNIDDNPESPAQYGVRGIPTMILFVGGEIKATKMGALSRAELSAFLDTNI